MTGITKGEISPGLWTIIQNLINHSDNLDAHVSTYDRNLWNSLQAGPKSVDDKSMNNVTNTGFYYGYVMSDSASKTISTFIVIRYSADWIIQIQIIPSASPVIYMRSFYNGSTWSPWRVVPSTVQLSERTAAYATLLNGFLGTALYAKDLAGNVSLELNIANTPTIAPMTQICRLPEGFRPVFHTGIVASFTNLSPFGVYPTFVVYPDGYVVIAHDNKLVAGKTDAGIQATVTFRGI